MESNLSFATREFFITPSSNASHEAIDAEREILTSFFEDNNKIFSTLALLRSFLPESTKDIKKPRKTKLQKLKELGLLGAIKNSEITSENYKIHLEDYFGKNCE